MSSEPRRFCWVETYDNEGYADGTRRAQICGVEDCPTFNLPILHDTFEGCELHGQEDVPYTLLRQCPFSLYRSRRNIPTSTDTPVAT